GVGIPCRLLLRRDVQLALEIGQASLDHGAHLRLAPHHSAKPATIAPTALAHATVPHHADGWTSAAQHTHHALLGLRMRWRNECRSKAKGNHYGCVARQL